MAENVNAQINVGLPEDMALTLTDTKNLPDAIANGPLPTKETKFTARLFAARPTENKDGRVHVTSIATIDKC